MNSAKACSGAIFTKYQLNGGPVSSKTTNISNQLADDSHVRDTDR
jgi:hypothetical protein